VQPRWGDTHELGLNTPLAVTPAPATTMLVTNIARDSTLSPNEFALTTVALAISPATLLGPVSQ